MSSNIPNTHLQIREKTSRGLGSGCTHLKEGKAVLQASERAREASLERKEAVRVDPSELDKPVTI